jgi:hypothetical protein
MLASGVWILIISMNYPVNIWEFVFLRIGWSIYCGWMTAATIL